MNRIKYRSRTGIHSMHEGYRDVSVCRVASQMYMEMSKVHTAIHWSNLVYHISTLILAIPSWMFFTSSMVSCNLFLSWVCFYYMTPSNLWKTSNLVSPISKLICGKPSWINGWLCALWTFPCTFEKQLYKRWRLCILRACCGFQFLIYIWFYSFFIIYYKYRIRRCLVPPKRPWLCQTRRGD